MMQPPHSKLSAATENAAALNLGFREKLVDGASKPSVARVFL